MPCPVDRRREGKPGLLPGYSSPARFHHRGRVVPEEDFPRPPSIPHVLVVHVDQPHLVEFPYPLVERGVAHPHLPLHGLEEHPGRDGALGVFEGDPRDVLQQGLLFPR